MIGIHKMHRDDLPPPPVFAADFFGLPLAMMFGPNRVFSPMLSTIPKMDVCFVFLTKGKWYDEKAWDINFGPKIFNIRMFNKNKYTSLNGPWCSGQVCCWKSDRNVFYKRWNDSFREITSARAFFIEHEATFESWHLGYKCFVLVVSSKVTGK